MRYLVIFNGYSSKMSGGEMHAISLVNYLSAEKENIAVCLPAVYPRELFNASVGRVAYPALPGESHCYRTNGLLFFIYLYRIFVSSFKLFKNKSEIIIFSSHLFHDIFTAVFLRKKNKLFATYVYHILSDQTRSGFSSVITSWLEKLSFWVMRRNNFLVITDSARVSSQLVKKYGFAKNKVFSSKNGIDLTLINSIIQPVIKKYDLSFCGRLHHTKGIYDLIEIVDLLKKNNNNITCAVIGSGPEEENVKRLVRERKLEKNVLFLGFLSEAEKIKTIKEGKVFILPSHEEGWGIVIGEAMACSIPVVTYKLPDIMDIWKDLVVWVDCFDVSLFANTLEELLKNSERVKLIYEKGKIFSNSLDWENILENEVAILSEAFNSK